MGMALVGRGGRHWLALALLVGGCFAAESDGEEPGKPANEPPDAAAGDASAAAPPPTSTSTPTARTATAAACGAGPMIPTLSCLGPDTLEPNDARAPSSLLLSTACTQLQTQISEGDGDSFHITPTKSDPVQVTLSYAGIGTTDLDLTVVSSASGRTVALDTTSRRGPTEAAMALFEAVGGAGYNLSVTASGSVDDCQPYTLMVDTAYCTDDHEDNDTVPTATSVPLTTQPRVSVTATSHALDDDYYKLNPTKADPILVTGSYTSAASLSIDVDLAILGATGTTVAARSGTRATTSESWELWVPVAKADSVFHARVYATGTGCAPYTLTFDAAACTDAFEDNDERAHAIPLPLGAEHAVTALDDDNYDVSALPVGGRCTVRYTLAANSVLELSGKLRTQTDVVKESQHGAGTGSERSFVLEKSSTDVTTLAIESDSSERCQPYTIRCQ